jgi:predicted porin
MQILDSGNEYMLAASYNFGPVAVGAGYDRTKFFNQDVRKTWRVTAAAPITANDTIGLSYSRGSVDIDEGESYDAKGWGLSYSHAMSKRTNVYATYGQMSQDNELNKGADYSLQLRARSIVRACIPLLVCVTSSNRSSIS